MKQGAGLSVWVRLIKAYNMILPQARRSVEPGFTLPRFDVMVQLYRRPEGMTFVELSRNLLVSAGNLTGIVKRLEHDRLVARETNESDRRSARLRLTPEGRRRIAAAVPRHARDIERLFASVPRGEVEQLRRLLGSLTHALDRRTDTGGDTR